MIINPMLGGMLLGAVRPPPSRLRIDRIEGLAGVSRVARGAAAQLRHDQAHPGFAAVAAAEPAFAAPGPALGARPPLADETIATLNAIHAADADVIAHAMLAAAKAHGPVDAGRLKLMLEHLHDAGASDADRAYVLSHLTGPPDIEALAQRVHGPTAALEAYAVSALMVEPGAPAEAAYLARLEERLGIDPAAIRSLGLEPQRAA